MHETLFIKCFSLQRCQMTTFWIFFLISEPVWSGQDGWPAQLCCLNYAGFNVSNLSTKTRESHIFKTLSGMNLMVLSLTLLLLTALIQCGVLYFCVFFSLFVCQPVHGRYLANLLTNQRMEPASTMENIFNPCRQITIIGGKCVRSLMYDADLHSR